MEGQTSMTIPSEANKLFLYVELIEASVGFDGDEVPGVRQSRVFELAELRKMARGAFQTSSQAFDWSEYSPKEYERVLERGEELSREKGFVIVVDSSRCVGGV